MNSFQKANYTIDDLIRIMALLRSPEGCPWDREQTHQSIRKNLIEETYEVAEAIDLKDTALLKEELGDLLLQVVFHAQMEQEKNSFNFDDVCDGICKKLIHRHPHIFSNVKVNSSQEVLSNWDAIKKQEKNQKTVTQSLQSVPKTLPALMRSEKVQHRAAKAGFDYDHVDAAMQDLYSEVDELSQAIKSGSAEQMFSELGDVIFSAANVARFVKADSEQALTASCDKFISRFETVELLAKEQDIDLINADMDLLNNLWQEAKIKEL